MPASTETRSGLFYGWSLGESGWNAQMDANLLRIGRFGFHLTVKDRDLDRSARITWPPVTPTSSPPHRPAPGPATQPKWLSGQDLPGCSASPAMAGWRSSRMNSRSRCS